jgi:TonB family protein
MAELARVYTLSGRAEKALPLIDKAIALEPEFADRFYDLRGQAQASLKRFDDAYRTMRTTAALPHIGEKTDAIFEQKIKAMSERAENYRREADAGRVDQIRKDLDRVVDLLEPAPPAPEAPPPPRQSSMGFSIEAEREITVINRVYPEFPAALLQSGMGGEIIFDVAIDPTGRVTRIEVRESQLPDFDTSTMSSLRRWTFKPVEVDGQSVPFKMILTFRYEVDEVHALPAVR